MQGNFNILLLWSNEGDEEAGHKMPTAVGLQKRKAVISKDEINKE